eukprot:scaffold1231_cov107-Cylindrotheca_fusiformis.AAC.12
MPAQRACLPGSVCLSPHRKTQSSLLKGFGWLVRKDIPLFHQSTSGKVMRSFSVSLHPSMSLVVMCIALLSTVDSTSAFALFDVPGTSIGQPSRSRRRRIVGTTKPADGTTTDASVVTLSEMKRPILDQIASTLFQLENDRVRKSSVEDDQGRIGEPMEWSESNSLANKFSQLVQNNELGYQFKQFVADIVAGQDFDQEATAEQIDTFVASHPVAMFSFTSCIEYVTMELDELPENQGNEIRAMLGRKTRRTSVPSIFINGQSIGGCNDGPGLLPLAESGELKKMLASSSS